MPNSIAVTILRIASLSMLAFGVLWSLAPYDPVNTPAIWLIDLLDWPIDANITEFDRYDQWFSAVASSFLIGMALIFLLLVCPLIEEGNKRARSAGLISLTAWFASDCFGSYAAGVPINILWNVFFVLPFVVPLMLVDLDGKQE